MAGKERTEHSPEDVELFAEVALADCTGLEAGRFRDVQRRKAYQKEAETPTGQPATAVFQSHSEGRGAV